MAKDQNCIIKILDSLDQIPLTEETKTILSTEVILIQIDDNIILAIESAGIYLLQRFNQAGDFDIKTKIAVAQNEHLAALSLEFEDTNRNIIQTITTLLAELGPKLKESAGNLGFAHLNEKTEFKLTISI
ncbi:MAG: hypothetical protein HY973_03535 [Candidatus Kerfeldbacteria bacterium]|nr:hypothetical protein [Candidatus Kerfeldbacteria bacterium]